MDELTPAEFFQLKLIYAAVLSVLGYEETNAAELQKSIQAGIRSLSFQVAIAGHGGSGSVKYGDRYPPLSKCITAFKSNIAGMDIKQVREIWRWMGRESHDTMLRRYTRQFGSTAKICSCIGYAIKWQHQHDGRNLLANGDKKYEDKQNEKDFIRQFQMGKMMIVGIDKIGRPLVVIRTKLHFPKEQDRDVVRNVDVLLAETCTLLSKKLQGVTVIYDLTQFTQKNRDASMLKFGIHNFTKIYPGVMSHFFFHNAPQFYKTGYKIIGTAVDATLKAKIKFTNSTEELLEHVDLDQLPKHLGGTSKLDAVGWIPPSEEDDILMQDTVTRDALQAEREMLLDRFHVGLSRWINGNRFPERNELLKQLESVFMRLDPYVRSKTIWDRQGLVKLCRPDIAGMDSDENLGNDMPEGDLNAETASIGSLTPPSLHEPDPFINPSLDSVSSSQSAPPDSDGVLFDQDAVFESFFQQRDSGFAKDEFDTASMAASFTTVNAVEPRVESLDDAYAAAAATGPMEGIYQAPAATIKSVSMPVAGAAGSSSTIQPPAGSAQVNKLKPTSIELPQARLAANISSRPQTQTAPPRLDQMSAEYNSDYGILSVNSNIPYATPYGRGNSVPYAGVAAAVTQAPPPPSFSPGSAPYYPTYSTPQSQFDTYYGQNHHQQQQQHQPGQPPGLYPQYGAAPSTMPGDPSHQHHHLANQGYSLSPTQNPSSGYHTNVDEPYGSTQVVPGQQQQQQHPTRVAAQLPHFWNI